VQQPASSPADEGRGLIIFLRGSWMHSSAWSSWRVLVDRNGYDSAIAPWPGEKDTVAACRSGWEGASPETLRALVDSAEARLADARPMPILIGHGLGAVIAQVLIARRRLAAGAIALAPPAAGWASRSALLRLTATRASLGASAFTSSRLPTFAAFARTYANTISRGEAADLYARFVIPGSIKPLLRASWMVRAPGRTAVDSERPPLLLLSGGKDRLCPESTTRSWERFGRRRYPDDVTDHHVFPDRGHSLTVDAGWEDIGNFCLDWLTDHNL
jgi:non-heme chloroperoxidase